MGTDGQYLMADSTQASGISWQSTTNITSLGTITTGVWNGTTIAIANGGTGATTVLGAFNGLSPLTTKGDLLGYFGGNNVRVGVGSDGFILTSDSTASPGVSWKCYSYSWIGEQC